MSQEDVMINRIYNERTAEARRNRNAERTGQMSVSIAREANLSRELSINPEDFRDLYGDAVDKDKRDVEQTKKNIKEHHERTYDKETLRKRYEAQELAAALEFLVFKGIQEHSWLGGNTRVVKTSEFDDLFNGVDLVAEFRKGTDVESQLGLAIDVSFSGSLEKKLARIKAEIDRGELAKVKYFKSDTFRGELRGIPRVVAGLDGQSTLGLAQLWQSQEKRFAMHPAQHTLLQEILVQLEVFRGYAERVGKIDIVPHYNRAYRVIDSIIRQKGGKPELTAAAGVFKKLEATLAQVFSTSSGK